MPSDNAAYAPHIPDAVRRASLRADELARQAGVANVAPAPEVDGSGDNSEGSNQASEVTTVGNSLETAPAASASSATVQPVDGLQELPAPAPPQPQFSEWEQRYNTLQGKYNTELPELRGQIRSLENLIAAMQSAPRQETAPAPHVPATLPAAPVAREIPSADVEAWGQDLVDAAQRWAEARLAPRMEELERRVAAAEVGSQRVETRTAQQSVEASLDRAVPTWREVNVAPEFLVWLDQADPFSGAKRQVLLTDAHRAGDAPRTIAIFQGFLREQTAVSQPPGIPPNQTGAPPADRLPLEHLAVPGRGQTAPPAQGAPERRVWSTAEITQFYRQKQRGMWDTRQDEAERLEADIIAAGREGRVRS